MSVQPHVRVGMSAALGRLPLASWAEQDRDVRVSDREPLILSGPGIEQRGREGSRVTPNLRWQVPNEAGCDRSSHAYADRLGLNAADEPEGITRRCEPLLVKRQLRHAGSAQGAKDGPERPSGASVEPIEPDETRAALRKMLDVVKVKGHLGCGGSSRVTGSDRGRAAPGQLPVRPNDRELCRTHVRPRP